MGEFRNDWENFGDAKEKDLNLPLRIHNYGSTSHGPEYIPFYESKSIQVISDQGIQVY